jgi:cyclopropane-fatty-acyl-phospholipid synthase
VNIIAKQPQTILLNEQTFIEATRDLPFVLRKMLRVALHIEAGELHVYIVEKNRILQAVGHKPGPIAHLNIHAPRMARRIALGGDIGVAEGYLNGEWDSPDITAFLQVFAANASAINEKIASNPIIRFFQKLYHMKNKNTKKGSRKNIEAHYDLGNNFYEKWLDPSMTYSSAMFDETQDLKEAQSKKYAALAQSMDLQAGHSVLEIGCGWGGFAEFAAKEIGARITGLTISPSQYAFAKERIFKSGLNEKVDFKLQDYRDEKGLYDRIASIEMFEAVGEEYWPRYFDQVSINLKEGGKAGLQVITIQDRFFDFYRREVDFIRRYIFPGGMLPTPSIMKKLGHEKGLNLSAEKVFGLDYAQTLAHWRERFLAAWPQIQPLGFDERFRKLWVYYLSYCEAGFRAGNIDVRQLIYTKT